MIKRRQNITRYFVIKNISHSSHEIKVETKTNAEKYRRHFCFCLKWSGNVFWSNYKRITQKNAKISSVLLVLNPLTKHYKKRFGAAAKCNNFTISILSNLLILFTRFCSVKRKLYLIYGSYKFHETFKPVIALARVL